ncbi:hypothetical protein ACFSUK_08255 [Sphingobium scionense]|uniref:Uncharacterized protein n=1 Tax=Sphingobium scionense TaxID=1404341 RepID=A0A7W6LTK4_9SPHN|nr:hypothetical protein [Sphingobium scionense]MBB4149141.1 hypothetical protein [Sphingobium scionense]
MTALAIQSPGVSSAAVRTGKVYPPSVLGLEGLLFLGESIEESVINRSPLAGKANAVAIGSPGVEDNYLLLKNQIAYLQTQIVEVDEMTIIAWHTAEYLNFNAVSNSWTTRQGGTGNSYGLSMRVGGGASPATGKQNYSSMGYRASNDNTSNGTQANVSHTAVVNGGAAGSYMTHAGRFSLTEAKHNILTTGSGTTTVAITAGNVRDKASGLLRLGSAMVGGGDDEFRMCGAAIYSRLLSDQELADFYDWLAMREANRGLGV